MLNELRYRTRKCIPSPEPIVGVLYIDQAMQAVLCGDVGEDVAVDWQGHCWNRDEEEADVARLSE